MKLIVLDRDGVINQDSDRFIKNPDEWVPIEGSLEAISRLTHANFHVVVATNQSGIGRGLFDIDALNRIHQKMHKMVATAGGLIEAVFFCPHSAESRCECRKPKPGMLHEIERRYGISIKGVPFVGDSLRDLQAAVSAHALPFLVLTGKGEKTLEQGNLPPHTRIFPSLAAVVDTLLLEEEELLEQGESEAS
ncbi:MAG: D-glycero-beta-D-manno-heptose 1,7-bisphosphate 7-phosphatase [Pseudomonadota bacterium]